MSNPPQDSADALVARLAAARGWCVRDALPFWGETGFDRAYGGFHERTDLAGRPVLDVPRRTMVQARQIYVFAHAALLGWWPAGAEPALCAAEHLLARNWRADGADGFVFSTDGAGRVVDARRDAYAHAFVAFGLAYAWRLAPEPALRAAADAVFAFFDGALRAERWGGHLGEAPRRDSLRRQNPHMHLFEACLAWYEATGEARYLARAGEIFGLFTTRFMDGDAGVLIECFDDAWRPAPGPEGSRWEPGHHFEWIWLLRRYAAASGRSVDAWVQGLLAPALAQGFAADGLIHDTVGIGGGTVAASSRVWPHAEALKAAAAETEAGRSGMEPLAARALDALTGHFLGRPFAAGWIDHLTPDRTALSDFAPASTLYHLMLALAEASRVFDPDAPALS
jgi:mannose-6-phosphate isomerase